MHTTSGYIQIFFSRPHKLQVVFYSADSPTCIENSSFKLYYLHRQSGHIAFLDSSGNMDKTDIRLFLIVTSTDAGAIPLGMVKTKRYFVLFFYKEETIYIYYAIHYDPNAVTPCRQFHVKIICQWHPISFNLNVNIKTIVILES